MSPVELGLLSVVVLLLLLLSGIPVYLSLSLVGLGGIALISDLNVALSLAARYAYSRVASYPLLVIPMFVMLGSFAFAAGISRDAYDIGRKWLGRLPGGLLIATIFASAAFAATCGSSPAAAAAVGRIAIPEMTKAGYDKKLACGVVAAAGCLAIMIPPSIILVLYGTLTETSIGALLIGGIVPGILTAFILSVGTLILTYRNPSLTPPVQSYPWREKVSSLKGIWGVLVIFFIIIGGIYFGVTTPTEAAVLGTWVGFLLVLHSRQNIADKLKSAFAETVHVTTMVLLLLLSAMFYSYFLVVAGVPAAATEWVLSLGVSPQLVLILCLVAYIPLGMFLEPVSILLITLPILHPIIVRTLGFDSIYFGILVTVGIQIAQLTPPVGINAYVIASVADMPLKDVFRGVLWYIILMIIAWALLVVFPTLSTWLPTKIWS